ncbi:MAG: alpha/beta hydrolase [Ignavibacteriae bacterium]|nr:MAG: alpha/beta hydrolase [Ignavibacteriota bacterium]
MKEMLKKINITSNVTEINCDLFLPEMSNNALKTGESSEKNAFYPLVIFSHGFKGFKDWGGFPYMMQKFADNGFAAASFNFTHNGVSNESSMDFTRLDLFAGNTFSKELNDLHNVIDYFYNNADAYNIDNQRFALIGHSRGGGTTIIKGSEDNRIKCIVTLASVSGFDRYSEEHKKKWKEAGYFEVLNSRTNQMMRMNVSLLEDIEDNRDRLDIIKAMKNLKKPALIIHGKEDLSVRSEEAEKLFENSNKEITELYIVPNTGHTFGTEHPFKGTTPAFEKVIDKAVSFLKEKL